MQQAAEGIERLFSIAQIAQVWCISEDKVRELFLGRPGLINVGTPRRRLWRIPMSVVEAVIKERGMPAELSKTLKERA